MAKTIHTISSVSHIGIRKDKICGYDIAYNETKRVRIDDKEPIFALVLHFKPLASGQKLLLTTYTDKQNWFKSILNIKDEQGNVVTYKKFGEIHRTLKAIYGKASAA